MENQKETERSRKLAVARQQFQSGRVLEHSFVKEAAPETKKYMPYWANYLLRTFVTLFLLLGFYLYGVVDAKNVDNIAKVMRENFNSNPTIWAACETYSQVDYRDACEKMIEYAKGVFQNK